MTYYPEGSFFERLFQDHPNTVVFIASDDVEGTTMVGGKQVFISASSPEPSDPVAKDFWMFMQGIKDLM